MYDIKATTLNAEARLIEECLRSIGIPQGAHPYF